jgi:hypothetical protein
MSCCDSDYDVTTQCVVVHSVVVSAWRTALKHYRVYTNECTLLCWCNHCCCRGSNAEGQDRRVVPAVAIHTFFKYYEPPSMSEGFVSIEQIPFVPGPFRSERERELLYMHLLP